MTFAKTTTISSVLAALGVLLGASNPAWAGCPKVDELRLEGELEHAELAARNCLQKNPRDGETYRQLAQVVAAQNEFHEAIDWINKAIELYPQEHDYRFERARLLYWAGDPAKAHRELEALPMYIKNREEVLLLRADAASAAGEIEAAAKLYDEYLLKNPKDAHALYRRGLVLKDLQEYEPAETSLATSCEIGGSSTGACGALATLDREAPPNFYSVMQPSYFAVPGGIDGYSMRAVAGGVLSRRLALEIGAEYRSRGFRDRRLDDTIGEVDAQWHFTRNLRLTSGFAGSPDADFSPVWSAYVEPGYTIDGLDLDFRAKYRRIMFNEGGVHLANPGVEYTVGPFIFDAGYYLTIEDPDITWTRNDNGISHAGLVKGFYFLGDITHVYLGGGAGNSTDYLDMPRDAARFHFVGVGGIRWEFIRSNTVMLDYQYRNELFDDRNYQHHQFALGYRKDFW